MTTSPGRLKLTCEPARPFDVYNLTMSESSPRLEATTRPLAGPTWRANTGLGGWSWGGGSRYYQWDSSWGYHDWGSNSSTTTSSTQGGSSGSELLPQFIQGWYLLADANLDANERNIVMSALAGDFDPHHRRSPRSSGTSFPSTT